MKAIVIGATGLVGSELLKQLLNEPRFAEVSVFTRRATGLKQARLTEHLVDFDSPDEWNHLVQGDVLFSCMGTTLKKAGSKEKQWTIDFSYQLNAAQAAAYNQVTTCILISSAGADKNARVFYSRMKGELDEAVQKLPFQHCYILRPSLLLGNRKEKRTSERIAKLILPLVTRFAFKKYRPIEDKTVARAVIELALNRPSKTIYELDELFELIPKT